MQDEVISQIKQKLDIVSVIEKYIELKPAGKNFTARCPFHTEKTPSFNVSPELQMFKCFGCGKTGDIFTFVMEIEKLEFIEAKKKLADMAGVKLEDSLKPRNYVYTLNEDATSYFQRQLLASSRAKEYLTKRGLTKEDIQKFKIGYAPKSNGLLTTVQLKRKLNKKQLLDSGLFIENNNELRDKFRDRIIFPIFNKGGEIIAFTGRLMPDNEYGPKYINSPDTPIFHKSSNVYGINFAKYGTKKEDLCIICEGTVEVIMANRCGISNIVAPLGTSLTIDQLKLVSQFTKNILFLFNSDNAGQKALERAFLLANELNLTSFATNTSPYKDIDEMVLASPDLLRQRISERKDAFTYLVASKVSKLDISTLKDREYIKAFVRDMLKSVQTEDMRKFYTNQIKGLLGENIPVQNSYQDKWIPDQRYRRPQKNDLEISLLSSILKTEPISVGYIDFQYLSNDTVKQIIQLIREKNITSLNELHKKLENTEIKAFIESIALKSDIGEPESPQAIYDRIMTDSIHKTISILGTSLAAAEKLGNEEEVEKLSSEIFDLTNKLRILRK